MNDVNNELKCVVCGQIHKRIMRIASLDLNDIKSYDNNYSWVCLKCIPKLRKVDNGFKSPHYYLKDI